MPARTAQAKKGGINREILAGIDGVREQRTHAPMATLWPQSIPLSVSRMPVLR
jgi:hypothetical protein